MSLSSLPLTLKTYSVLPDNYSSLERALELSFSQQIFSNSSLFPALLDADKAPPAVLPYLAAERLLPVWDAQDTDAIKRQLTGNAWQVRRLSGTRAGLKLALDALDFQSEITPWYEQTPKGEPYSLDIIAWEKGNQPVNVNKVKKLLAYLDDIQSERDQVSLSLMFGVSTQVGLCVASAPPTTVTSLQADAALWPMPVIQATVSVAGALSPAISIQPLSIKAEVPVIEGEATLGLVGAGQSLTINFLNARASHE